VCVCVLAQSVDGDVAVFAVVAGAWLLLQGSEIRRGRDAGVSLVTRPWAGVAWRNSAEALLKRLCRRTTEVVWHLCGWRGMYLG
jgi:hypothetical protein